jgi:hypothetical protein
MADHPHASLAGIGYRDERRLRFPLFLTPRFAYAHNPRPVRLNSSAFTSYVKSPIDVQAITA